MIRLEGDSLLTEDRTVYTFRTGDTTEVLRGNRVIAVLSREATFETITAVAEAYHRGCKEGFIHADI